MQTQRLYLDQTYLIEFDAVILRTFPYSEFYAIVLNQTAFYPTSGGQMHDTGTINGIEVRDVIEDEGEILHLLASPIDAVSVRCKIDWQQRFDFMQQHTAFHVLARSFFKILGIRTLSSHLGEEVSTIDVDIQTIDPDVIAEVERLSNHVIFENRSVKAYFTHPQQIDPKRLRKDVPELDEVRLVEIDDFDLDPCGGTHVNSTGEVGLVKILRWEKIRGYLRFEFVAGWRALRDYQKKWVIAAQISNSFSASEDELVNSVEKLQDEFKSLIKKNKKLAAENIGYESQQLVREAQQNGKKIITILFEDRDLAEIRYLAKQVTQTADVWILFGLNDEKAHLIFARPENCQFNLNHLVAQVAHLIDGRGGGRPHFFEIGGSKKSALEEALQSARVILENSTLN